MTTKIKKIVHGGNNFDDDLREQGIYEEVVAQAWKNVIARQLRDHMEAQKLSQNKLAHQMGTSMTLIRRLLNPKDTGMTLKTLLKAASVLGLDLEIQLKKREQN